MRRRAREEAATDLGVLKRWWTAKYRLPATHELFMSQTRAELMLERYSDLFGDLQALEAERKDALDDSRIVEVAALEQRIDKLRKVLGVVDVAAAVHDPVVAGWKESMARGEVPDLGRAERGPDGKIRFVEGR